METEKKVAVLLEQKEDGEIRKREITQEELGRIFFDDGNFSWDNIHRILPEPVWERVYRDGALAYEGFTLNHKALGAGKVFYPDGKPRLEGVFGIKGLLCGREYYPNGRMRFEGVYRLNRGYGPNFPEYGSWYDEEGNLKFRGKFSVFRSNVGLPFVEEPKGFSWEKSFPVKDLLFMWEDAKKHMKSYMPRVMESDDNCTNLFEEGMV